MLASRRIIVFLFLEMDGQGESSEFSGKNGAHAMGHVELFAEELLESIADRGDFDMAKCLDQSGVVLGPRFLGSRGPEFSIQG